MKILKHGDLQPRKFKCSNCGCEFVADKREYDVQVYCTYEGNLESYYVDCPDCMYRVFARLGDAPIYNENINNTLNNKLTKIIDKLDRYVHENISIYDHDIYTNLCDIIDDLSAWQEEYENESNINN